MRSITYAGHDFVEWCGADVVARSANRIVADAMGVPGRPGSLLLDGQVPPQDVVVRLYLDPRHDPGDLGMAELRHLLRSWLCEPSGGTLVLPDDPEVEYHDALLVAADGWSSLFEDGSCELTFTLFDPVGWGLRRYERNTTFAVGGTWRTYPSFSLVAGAGSAVQVMDLSTERLLRVEHAFAGGEVVMADCASERVTIDGYDARVDVTLGSDFFALEPGQARLLFDGCDAHETFFCERWL